MRKILLTAFVLACLLVTVVAVPAMAVKFQQQEFIIEMLLWQRQYRPVPQRGMENA